MSLNVNLRSIAFALAVLSFGAWAENEIKIHSAASAAAAEPLCLSLLSGETSLKKAADRPAISLIEKVGNEESLFYRGGVDDLTTVQVRTVSGNRPLVGAYFPAGNSGTMMMLEGDKPPKLHIIGETAAVQSGRDRGVITHVRVANLEKANGRSVLNLASFALGSVRFLRDHVVVDHGSWVEYGMKPDEIHEHAEMTANGDLFLHRTSLSGKARYTMRIHPLYGAKVKRTGRSAKGESRFQLVGGPEDRIDFEVTMTSSEPPRIGVRANELVEPWFYVQMTDKERQKLEFLFYEDGAVAGAHAYMTYFGRDPLITAIIAQDAFTPRALKIIAAAALDTVDETGNVAHEPEIGERASLTRKQRGEEPDRNGYYDETPIYDYTMIDTQFLVMPVIELLTKKIGAAGVRSFLARKSRSPNERTYAEQLTLNKDRILREASAFARAEMDRGGDTPDPRNFRHLIHLLNGRTTGNWRDSNRGLAGGRIPFETNTALVPAALNAVFNLYRLGLKGWEANEVKTVQEYHKQWRVKPYHYFRVEIANAEARAKGDAYARKLGLNVSAVDPFQGRNLIFYGVALDEEGKAIPLMHSDVSFAMLYTDPPAKILSEMMTALRIPYPYGLDSPAGQFVATAAYVNETVQSWFELTAYHAGIWSMQQEMSARGLKRQAARRELEPLQHEIHRTQFQVWRAIVRNLDWRAVELWSARVQNGGLGRMAFGTGKNIVAESCLNQFWSNTKIANFAPAGWEQIPKENLMIYLTWEGKAPLECDTPND